MGMTDTRVVHVISFGYGHTGALDEDGRTVLEPPEADVTLDLRRCLYNPHRDPAMRYLTGLDEVVYAHVMATPGAQLLVHNTVLAVHGLMDQARPSSLTVAAGCTGGRHRAVVMGRELARLLTEFGRVAGYGVELRHRDVHRPVLSSSRHMEEDDRTVPGDLARGCTVQPCALPNPEVLVYPDDGHAPLLACEMHASWLLAALPGATVAANPDAQVVPSVLDVTPDLNLVRRMAQALAEEHEQLHDGSWACCLLCDPGRLPSLTPDNSR